jgi:hypothetical protein
MSNLQETSFFPVYFLGARLIISLNVISILVWHLMKTRIFSVKIEQGFSSGTIPVRFHPNQSNSIKRLIFYSKNWTINFFCFARNSLSEKNDHLVAIRMDSI